MIEHSTFRNESRFILLYIWYSFNGYTVTYMYRLNKVKSPLSCDDWYILKKKCYVRNVQFFFFFFFYQIYPDKNIDY